MAVFLLAACVITPHTAVAAPVSTNDLTKATLSSLPMASEGSDGFLTSESGITNTADDAKEADFLDLFSKKVQKDINLFIKQTLEKKRIESEQLKEIVLSYINEKYSWINERNSARLFSQGCYYAWKDGLL